MHDPISRRRARSLLAILALIAVGCGPAPAMDARAQAIPVQRPASAIPDARFVDWMDALSGPGGYFDTDNLISNESSYLHVMGALDRLGVSGGAYIGVGPDQNFSYIAQIRPELAFIVDIRRDNLVQHLMFKAMFELAPTRVEFLALLYGLSPPAQPETYAERPVEDVLAWVDGAPRSSEAAETAMEQVSERVAALGVTLTDADQETLERFHTAFIDAGLDLRFQSHGRAPRFYYPDHRALLLERDLDGRQVSYVSTEARYGVVRALQLANRVVPVVGDLAGTHALPAVEAAVRDAGLTVQAFYTSNVEFYLWQASTFDRYARIVADLPISESSVLIRSHFGGGFRAPHPQSVPGYYSTQLLQRIEDFRSVVADGGFLGYGDLVTRDALPLR